MNPVIHYKPVHERTPDNQYHKLLERILKQGRRTEKPHFGEEGKEVIMVVGHQIRFDLRNGFPLLTERDLLTPGKRTPSIFHQALGELFAFLNGARTQAELERFGCFWWKSWVTPEKCGKRGLEVGDLGPGSYGPAWRSFPTAEGKPYDQILNILEQIRELPHLRTHFISPWIPQYTIRGKGKEQKVVVAPCHGWLHIFTFPETQELTLHHFQRSADVPVGLPANLIQYGALTLMLAQVLGYEARELIYTLSDAHIYAGQIKDVEELLSTAPQRLPTVILNPEVKDLLAFRQEHFSVADYEPQSGRRRIWTPI